MIETMNAEIKAWVEETAGLTKPNKIVWIDGSAAQLEALRKEAVAAGILIPLNEKKYPGCYLHRSNKQDVARVESRTFVCTKDKRDAGPTNNWEDPESMYAKMRTLYDGVMAGKTMYVIPFSMGDPKSSFAKFGVELTDSIYVVLNMAIMARIGIDVLKEVGTSGFTKALHATGTLDRDNLYVSHFPEDNTIWSINSAYGGNALLGKKCLALRIASYLAKKEGWFAEHMLILGLKRPGHEIRYITAAFPSACGKTNLAMLQVPEYFRKKGYEVTTLGDDIAWLRIGQDGRLWAVNPEYGFFGVVPGTNEKTNPNALRSAESNTIYTNVAFNPADNTVWWEGLTDVPPDGLYDWTGEKWDPNSGTKAAHPNSRFTAPITQCPSLSPEYFSPVGVPVSAMIFGGRRAKTDPLVYEAFDWTHGVFVGASMASETTAAASDVTQSARRDPMAMLPFTGYNMGDYFDHWVKMGGKIPNPPRIYHVNWFKKDDEGHYIWPGFGDNLRALEWILRRVEGEADAVESPIGLLPKPGDIDYEGLDLSESTKTALFDVDNELWKEEAHDIDRFFKSIDNIPEELSAQLDALNNRLG